MSTFHALVLGVVQGLTEFLPISSTAHLRIVPALLGWPDPGAAFTAVTQLGTMTAVLVFFRSDLIRIATATLASVRNPGRRRDLDARLGRYIVIGNIPIGLLGLTFKDQIETGARDLYLIATTLVVLGLVLLIANTVGARRRKLPSMTARDGILVGLAQALALIPGVSRSGATISAGLFLGFDRATAARYSFLLSVPAVVLSGVLEFAGILTDATARNVGLVSLGLATLVAGLVGYASIALLLRFLIAHSTRVFVGYRVTLGADVLAMTSAGAIS